MEGLANFVTQSFDKKEEELRECRKLVLAKSRSSSPSGPDTATGAMASAEEGPHEEQEHPVNLSFKNEEAEDFRVKARSSPVLSNGRFHF